ncbi:hypothetical protein EV193_105348 [Herbihabitans rhizosphaerae]|uniref:Pentapeptide repeat protein n=1 Tax=Herbihabitans rhizosphaerae TaxID=1872711 RepID=A0A4Q7KM85_9PSEU|nr:pentapeptide repeat-containing protein [Herbihabitans rhizosphaerae]RZS37789.1 hypothetical protein EV193_105348 [Herbihabitans rhizosphaerae]
MDKWAVGVLTAVLLVAVVAGRLIRSGSTHWWLPFRADDSPGVDRRMARSVVLWLLIAVVVGSAAGLGLLAVLGWPRLPKSPEFTSAQMLDLLKIGLAVVAGFGGVVALAVTYRKQKVAEEGHRLSLRQDEREGTKLFNERFGAAAEQLAHESAAVRLAGVYAMAGLADDWEDQRQTCVEVLCAYLRLPRKVGGQQPAGEPEVVGTIFRVLRDRLAASGFSDWKNLDYDFTGVSFEDADFSGLEFKGHVKFDQAVFTGHAASFAGAHFSGELGCQFVGTSFECETLDFNGVVIDGAARVQLLRIELAENSSVEFAGSAVISGTLLFADSSFTNVKFSFTRVQLGAQAEWHTSGRVRISDCAFDECRLDFSGTSLEFGRVSMDNPRMQNTEVSGLPAAVYRTPQ